MYVDLIQLEEEVDGFLMDFGFQVVDLQYGGTGPSKVFRVFIDHVDGRPVTIDDCSALAPQLILFLEMKQLYNDRTSLEVSSAGLSRVLKRSRDFERFLGSEIKATYHLGGRRETVRGELASFNDEYLMIILPEQRGGATAAEDATNGAKNSVQISRENLDRVNLVPQLEI